MNNDLFKTVTGATNWLYNEALPYWASAGFDETCGTFHEKVSFDGSPLGELPRRLMVQCRQLSVLSFSYLRGSYKDIEKIEARFAKIVDIFYDPNRDVKWAFSVDSQGKPLLVEYDSYSLTFLIFCISWLYRITSNAKYLEYVDEIYIIFDTVLASPNGGIMPSIESSVLLQNPNMHFLEACIAMFSATGRECDRAKAILIGELFIQKIFNDKYLALAEKHSTSWDVLESEDNWFEPGHHFEWAWLFRRLSQISGVDYTPIISNLTIRAYKEGIDASHLVIERINLISNAKTTSRRLWGTCEYIKYLAASLDQDCLKHGSDEFKFYATELQLVLKALFENFLNTSVLGLWHDKIDQYGNCTSAEVPASSLYHIAFAIFECERVLKKYSSSPLLYKSWKRIAVFLDRDGVINFEKSYIYQVADIEFLPKTIELIKLANAVNIPCIVVTNQSGVARGYYDEVDVINLHKWMDRELKIQNAIIDAWYYCPYHDASISELYRSNGHFDRKPNAGMLYRAASELNLDLANSYLVGDQPSDFKAADKANLKASFDISEIDSLIRILKTIR